MHMLELEFSKNIIKVIGKCDRFMHMLELELSRINRVQLVHRELTKIGTLVARFLFQVSRAVDTIFPAHNYSGHLN
jgi:hypothetical protein